MNDLQNGGVEGFACDLYAFTPDEREYHMRMATALFAALEEGRELADGYAFRVPDGSEALRGAAEFVAFDRRCCPFFHFRIDVEPYGGPIWLSISGEPGVKAALLAELGGLLNEKVARQIGLNAGQNG